jgi:hypothetical protein
MPWWLCRRPWGAAQTKPRPRLGHVEARGRSVGRGERPLISGQRQRLASEPEHAKAERLGRRGPLTRDWAGLASFVRLGFWLTKADIVPAAAVVANPGRMIRCASHLALWGPSAFRRTPLAYPVPPTPRTLRPSSGGRIAGSS